MRTDPYTPPRLQCFSVEVTPFQQNARILTVGNTAIVVDPGGDIPLIINFLASRALNCKEIWLTHSHLDHCGGAAELKERTGALIRAHSEGKVFRQKVEESAAFFGLNARSAGMSNCPEPDIYLNDGETLEFESEQFSTFHTPGHAPDHIVFLHADTRQLIGGDLLFRGSVGRVDLPGGDMKVLQESLRRVIVPLPDVTKVLPGHGPDTTVGIEKRSNPFMQEL
jgi:hydroxyacylglutathione hydrolase